jgi:3-oxoacyl-[acyl-carrier protein] reductase
MKKLDGKTAIITGAGRGIGRAIALKLGAEGANLIINDLDEAPAQETLAALASKGITAYGVVGDVTKADFPNTILSMARERFGGIDIIINNAGYIWNSTIQNTSDEQWEAMLAVHATAPFRLLRAASEYFRTAAKAETAARGRPAARKVVNISSISGLHGASTQIAYAAGKAALIGVTKTLAKEWGRYNVTVNCVAFGHIETRLTQALTEGPKAIEVSGRQFKVGLAPAAVEMIKTLTPLQRAGTTDEAAGAVFLFCIPESDFITGQILECSGGLASAA